MFTIVGPSQEFLNLTSPNGQIGESKEFASIELLIEYGTFKLLTSGDSQASELSQANSFQNLASVSVLQLPHHGSQTGISEELLKNLHPQLGVISVGANNRYHHPSPFTLTMLHQAKIPFKRTDQSGDIELVSDGKGFKVY